MLTEGLRDAPRHRFGRIQSLVEEDHLRRQPHIRKPVTKKVTISSEASLALHWGFIGTSLGRHRGCIGASLGLRWGLVGASLGLRWGFRSVHSNRCPDLFGLGRPHEVRQARAPTRRRDETDRCLRQPEARRGSDDAYVAREGPLEPARDGGALPIE